MIDYKKQYEDTQKELDHVNKLLVKKVKEFKNMTLCEFIKFRKNGILRKHTPKKNIQDS